MAPLETKGVKLYICAFIKPETVMKCYHDREGGGAEFATRKQQTKSAGIETIV